MSELFEKFNDEKIDTEEFEEVQLSEIEKKSIKKRIAKKLRKRSLFPVKTLSAVASLALFSMIAVNTQFALADIPIIGEKLEAFVYSQAGTLTDYKTVIGDSVEKNGVKVTLNEVILDDGQLLISSTFHTKLAGTDLAYNWYSNIDVYIDGQEMELGGGGGPQKITESYIPYFWAADIGHIDLQKEKSIRIVFNDLERSDSEKIIEGKWSFNFKASGENLMANTKKVPIHQHFTLDNGQTVEVEELILTPVTSQISYKMSDIHDDVYFRIEDEHGQEVQEIGGQYSGDENSGYENYNRFAAIEGHKIKIIPVVSATDHSYEYILTDEIFEVELGGE